MRVFGSLTNRIMEDVKSPVPVVGMGVTMLMFSDRHAGTVVEVFSGKKIAIQEDTAKRIDQNGMSESQDYAYISNPYAPIQIVTLRQDGRWRIVNSQTVVLIGERDTYHDYSF